MYAGQAPPACVVCGWPIPGNRFALTTCRARCATFLLGGAAAFGLMGMAMAIGGFKLVRFTMRPAEPITFDWEDEDPGACTICGTDFELVRPGKSQPTCSCWEECSACGAPAGERCRKGCTANIQPWNEVADAQGEPKEGT